MKKLTFITGSLPPIHCGVGFYSERFLQELGSDKNIAVTVVSTRGVAPDLSLPLLTTPNWKVSALPSLVKKIRQSSPDIIHLQYPAVGYKRQLGINLLPYLLRLRLPRTRLLMTLHEYHESRLLGRLRNLVTIMPIRTIVVSNEADRQALPGWVRKRVSVIPISSNFGLAPADPGFYKQTLIKYGLKPSEPTLLFFGFAYPNKGLETLLAAMGQPELGTYQLLLLTDLRDSDDYQKGLLQQINQLNAAGKRVAWAGFLADEQVSVILQAGTYFVLPQQQPLSPKAGTAITAALSGLIVISKAGNTPGVTAPFEHQVNSYLLPNMTAQALAAAIQQLEQSPELRQTIKAGAAELSKYFSWDNIIKKHLELYETDR